jgi:hypothetical protein
MRILLLSLVLVAGAVPVVSKGDACPTTVRS